MAFRKICNRPTPDDLLQRYERKGASMRTLAKRYGVHPTTIREWILAAGSALKPVGDKDGKAWRGRRDRRRLGLLVCALGVWLGGCAPSHASVSAGTAVHGQVLPHLNLRVFGGDGQSIPVGSTTPNPVIVAVADDQGLTAHGITIGFASYDRSVPVATVDVDQNGVAKATVPAVARGPNTITIFIWAGYGYATPVTVTVTGY